uniref:Potassium channel domain-containing protein n=1 Tax=viral metagenome TaxID=1070528 RepID=A0A6C0AR22_9ZZZZ
MKYIFRILVFHLTCIIIFATLYYIFKSDFDDENSVKHESLIDFILLATTTQASVGISGIYPVTYIGKYLMILQQLIMLSTHVFTVYFFTL